MALRTYKPTTPARRKQVISTNSEITKKQPEKSLLLSQKSMAGRNNQGKITTRHRGGGAKQHLRLVDFRLQDGLVGKIVSIEYDPNRSANIALLELEGGGKAYILAGSGMKAGQTVKSGLSAEVRVGNRLPLSSIPAGMSVYNIELTAGKGGQLVRSAGAKAQIAAKEGDWVQIRLPSGETRLVHSSCMATIGTVGREYHQNLKYGGAGRVRHLGRRPQVRGKAMNPVDHAHGGGEGQNSIGLVNPKTPWGKPALGLKTRRRKLTNKYIVRPRSKARRG